MGLTDVPLNKTYFKGVLIFAPILFYPPFFFDQVVLPQLRIGYFLLSTIYLFFSNRFYSKTDGYVLLGLCIYNLIMLNNGMINYDELSTILNYDLTFLFAWGLFRYFRRSNYRLRISMDLYVGFFYFIVISTILSFIFLQLFGEYDIFKIKSDEYVFYVTPFGVLFEKSFGLFQVYRGCFYFNEPIYAGAFYAANIVLVAPLINDRARLFIIANLLGGFLSMSMTFYFLLILLFMGVKLQSSSSKFLFILFLCVGVVASFGFDMLSYSSFDDRFSRYEIFSEIIKRSDDLQLLFGHGVIKNFTLDRGLSSGLLLSLVEAGVVGTFLVLVLYLKLSPNFASFIFLVVFVCLFPCLCW